MKKNSHSFWTGPRSVSTWKCFFRGSLSVRHHAHARPFLFPRPFGSAFVCFTVRLDLKNAEAARSKVTKQNKPAGRPVRVQPKLLSEGFWFMAFVLTWNIPDPDVSSVIFISYFTPCLLLYLYPCATASCRGRPCTSPYIFMYEWLYSAYSSE